MSDTNSNRQPQPIDKTMVEGVQMPPATGATVPGQTRPATRPGATAAGATNPYDGQIQNRGYQDLLPRGTESIPLGSGTIVGLLGTGGMARVYKIWNEKLEVFRAVKILIPTQQPDMLNRFETEAKITAKVRHPNIVEIYNVGDFEAGGLRLPYLEMEYIDGETLESLIARQGKLPDAVCCTVAIAVANALSYAHSQEFLLYGKTYKGIIHRDLKPANIMISLQGNIKLMDFGIARPTEASLHTVDGNIVGTMQYLSPEQLDGVDIDCRTDIYSFGAILYEMLTGAKTFPQDTITNLMRKKITNTYRKFNEFDFSVSKDLSHAAQKCLELAKEHRFASAEELVRNLESILRSLTSDSPAQVMHAYLADPAAFKTHAKKRSLPLFKPAVVIPAAAALAVGMAVTLFLLTGPRQAGKPAATAVPAVLSTPAPAAAADQAAPASAEEVRPLGPSPADQPSMQKEPLPVQTKTRQHATLKPAAAKKAQPAAQATAPKAKAGAGIEALKAKYGSNDLMETAKQAMNAGDHTGAVTALENVPPEQQKQPLRLMMLLEAYIEAGRLSDAQTLVVGNPLSDAQYDILCGRMYQAQGKDKKALDFYQNAMIKPSSVRNVKQVRQDALYHTAVVWTDHYRKSPSPDSKLQAVNAWTAVTRMHTDSPNHPRLTQAAAELSRLQ